jgi:hypothetical protein
MIDAFGAASFQPANPCIFSLPFGTKVTLLTSESPFQSTTLTRPTLVAAAGKMTLVAAPTVLLKMIKPVVRLNRDITRSRHDLDSLRAGQDRSERDLVPEPGCRAIRDRNQLLRWVISYDF